MRMNEPSYIVVILELLLLLHCLKRASDGSHVLRGGGFARGSDSGGSPPVESVYELEIGELQWLFPHLLVRGG